MRYINIVFYNTIAASGFGDPHISTLDGKEYTFNGLGEYVILKTDRDGFTMLGRTQKTQSSNGMCITCYCETSNHSKW